MSQEYRKLLNRALEKSPQKPGSGERFELPRLQLRRVGRRTFFLNFGDIVGMLNRDPQHVLKFLTKELATAANIDGGRIVFQGVFGPDSLNRLIKIYVEKYVICPICGRPDTKISKQDRFVFLECEACGARSSVLSG